MRTLRAQSANLHDLHRWSASYKPVHPCDTSHIVRLRHGQRFSHTTFARTPRRARRHRRPSQRSAPTRWHHLGRARTFTFILWSCSFAFARLAHRSSRFHLYFHRLTDNAVVRCARCRWLRALRAEFRFECRFVVDNWSLRRPSRCSRSYRKLARVAKRISTIGNWSDFGVVIFARARCTNARRSLTSTNAHWHATKSRLVSRAQYLAPSTSLQPC